MNAISEVNERRTRKAPRTLRTASLGDVVLDLDTYAARVGGRMVDLTCLEFDLLRLFVENPGRILPYRFWTSAVLDKSDYGAQRHLAVLVHRVRQKITGARPYVIKTVRGRGYGFLLTGGPDND